MVLFVLYIIIWRDLIQILEFGTLIEIKCDLSIIIIGMTVSFFYGDIVSFYFINNIFRQCFIFARQLAVFLSICLLPELELYFLKKRALIWLAIILT